MLITAILISIAGIANAVMDALRMGWIGTGEKSTFWSWQVSWYRKYKDYKNGDTRPKFWGAKSFLVWLTDGWHLMQEIMIIAFCAATTTYEPWLGRVWDILILVIVFSASFHIFYHWVFERNKIK